MSSYSHTHSQSNRDTETRGSGRYTIDQLSLPCLYILYGSANSQDNSFSMLCEAPEMLLQVQHVGHLKEHTTWQPMAHVG